MLNITLLNRKMPVFNNSKTTTNTNTNKQYTPAQTQNHFDKYANYQIPFTGAHCTDLAHVLKNHPAEIFPPKVLSAARKIVDNGNAKKKTLFDIQREVYKPLYNCKTLNEAKNIFPEFKEVKSIADIHDFNEKSAFGKIANGKGTYLNPTDCEPSLELLRMVYADCFSHTDLKPFIENANPTHLLSRLNIPIPNKRYGSVLKFSDKKFSETNSKLLSDRLTGKTKTRSTTATNRGASSSITKEKKARPPLTAKQRQNLSEFFRGYWDKPGNVNQQSFRMKAFWDKNPELKEIFSEVMTKAWNKIPGVKEQMSKFFSQKNVTDAEKLITTPYHELTPANKDLMQKFWKTNPNAATKLGGAMKEAWSEVRNQEVAIKSYTLFPKSILNAMTKYAEETGIPKEKYSFDIPVDTGFEYTSINKEAVNISKSFFGKNPEIQRNFINSIYETCNTIYRSTDKNIAPLKKPLSDIMENKCDGVTYNVRIHNKEAERLKLKDITSYENIKHLVTMQDLIPPKHMLDIHNSMYEHLSKNNPSIINSYTELFENTYGKTSKSSK